MKLGDFLIFIRSYYKSSPYQIYTTLYDVEGLQVGHLGNREYDTISPLLRKELITTLVNVYKERGKYVPLTKTGVNIDDNGNKHDWGYCVVECIQFDAHDRITNALCTTSGGLDFDFIPYNI